MSRKAVWLLASLGVAVIVTPAGAHHSHQVYEDEKTITAEGVISHVRWANPHVYITLDVPAADGTKQSWMFELAPIASVLNSGISAELVKVGKPAKIIAHPAKDPNKHTGLFLGLEVDGKVYARGTRAR